MQNDKKTRAEKIDRILAGLSAYYEKPLIEITIKVYHSMLAEYPVEAISAAAQQHIKESAFFPKVSELIDLMKPKTPSVETRAQQQAALVIERVRSFGYYREPLWDDPVTASLFRGRFNWKSLCNTLTEDETKWFVKEFCAAYDAVVGTGSHLQIEAPAEVKALVAPVVERFTVTPDAVSKAKAKIKNVHTQKRNLRKFTPEEIAEQKRVLLGGAK